MLRLKLPSLGTLMKDALKNGTVAKRISVDADEIKRIRDAERRGGHDLGLRTVLLILREKNEAKARERTKIDGQL